MKVIYSDLINILICLFSAIISVFYPLQTFILAFFILGPLHYITEVIWLEKKDFYIDGQRSLWLSFSVISSLVIGLAIVYGKNDVFLFLSKLFKSINGLLFFGLTYPLLVVSISNKNRRFVIGLFLFLITMLANYYYQFPFFIIGVFLSTLVHVYLFTILFMLLGVKKNKSFLGMVSIALVILTPVVYIFLPDDIMVYDFPQRHKDYFLRNNFNFVLLFLGKCLGVLKEDSFYFYEKTELKLLMFLSFAYLHHYLNWFAKTNITKWNKNIPITKIIVIIIFWLILITFVYLNISAAFFVVIFMSFLHVFLEFPLNAITLKRLWFKIF